MFVEKTSNASYLTLFLEHYSHDEETKSATGVARRISKISKIFREGQPESDDDNSAISGAASQIQNTEKEEAVLRSQLDNIKIYSPWFIYLITCLQAMGMMALVLMGGVAHIGMVPVRTTSRELTLIDRQ